MRELRTGFLFGFERGRILRELPLPSLRGLELIMQGLSLHIVVGRVWLRTGLLFGFERAGFLFGFERGRILRELPLPSLRVLELIIQGLSIHIVVGRVWLRTGFLFGFERGRILRELPLPSLRGLWLIMQGLSINIVVRMVWGILLMSQY